MRVKQVFLLLVFLFTAPSFYVNGGEQEANWEAKRQQSLNRMGKIIYDNDAGDIFIRKSSGATVSDFLAPRTSFLKKYPQIKTIYYGVMNNFVVLHHKTPSGFLFDYDLSKQKRTNAVTLLMRQGSSPLLEQIKFARKNDKMIFAGFRVNDIHDVYGEKPPLKKYPYYSPFKRKHPEFLVGSYTKQPPRGKWTAVDFDHKEVRDIFTACVVETIEQFDIDGVQLDFFRDPLLFRTVAWEQEVTQQQRDKFTEIMRKIKRSAEKYGKKRGRPVLVSIRVPDSVQYCRAIGVDLEYWMKEKLVDIVIARGPFELNPIEYMVKLCHRYGIKYYASIGYPEVRPGRFPLRRDVRSAFYGRISAAMAQGADGVFFFNSFYEHNVKAFMAPLETYKYSNKRYFVTPLFRTNPGRELCMGAKFNRLPYINSLRPLPLAPGKKKNIILEFGDDTAALKRENIRFKLSASICGNLPAPQKLQIISNGKTWKYDFSDGKRHCYTVPDDALKPGANTLSLTYQEQPKSIWKIILSGNSRSQWRMLFPSIKAKENKHLKIKPLLSFGRVKSKSYVELNDQGGDFANLLYAFREEVLPETNSKVNFESWIVNTSDQLSSVVRFANGKYVEVVSLAKDHVALLNAGVQTEFDTTGKFHSYGLIMTDKHVILRADGRVLLRGAINQKHAPENNLLRGNVYSVIGMNDNSLLIGSLSAEGTSLSRWRRIRLLTASNVYLDDFAVDINFEPKATPRKLEKWDYQNQDMNNLWTDKGKISTGPLSAEVQLGNVDGKVDIVVSTGALLSILRLDDGKLFSSSGKTLINNLPANPLLRFAFSSWQDGGILFVNNRPVTTLLDWDSVYNFNRSIYLNMLSPEQVKIIRNGGIVVRKIHGNVKVGALRMQFFDNRKRRPYNATMNVKLNAVPKMLNGGLRARRGGPMIAKISLGKITGKCQLIVSNGAVLIRLLLEKDKLTDLDSGQSLYKRNMENSVLSFEFTKLKTWQILLNQKDAKEIKRKNYARSFLKQKKGNSYNKRQRFIIRNSGIVVFDLDNGVEIKGLECNFLDN